MNLQLVSWKACWLVAFSVWSLTAVPGCGSDDPDEPADDGPTGTVTWCQVSEVLQAKCQRCHVDGGQLGAPFSLVSYDDTQVPESSGHGRRWEVMQLMVEEGFMPPKDQQLNPPAAQLTSDEMTTLTTWFDEGAKPVGGTSCN